MIRNSTGLQSKVNPSEAKSVAPQFPFNAPQVEEVSSQLSGYGYIYMPTLLKSVSWIFFLVHIIGAVWVLLSYSNLDKYPAQNINYWPLVVSTMFLFQGIIVLVFLRIISSLVDSSAEKTLNFGGLIIKSVSESLKSPCKQGTLNPQKDQVAGEAA